MSELENASTDEVWNYIAENPKILGLPLTETKGLDLLSAMRDVYLEMEEGHIDAAKVLLTLLATVLIAAAQGDGDEVLEEVIVSEAMVGIDKEIKKVLNEGH